MNVKKFISIALAMLVITCFVPVYANAQAPPLPHIFYGSVLVNGDPAPDKAYVKAEGEGVDVPLDFNPIMTDGGWYGGPAWNDPKLIVQGDIADETPLVFSVSLDGVNWYEATPSEPDKAKFESGAITELDLTVDIPVPTPVPRPPAGGGGGAAGPDIRPPTISNVASCPEGVTETTADICWRTNERSTSQIEYWTGPDKMLSPIDETLAILHQVQLVGLIPGTTYYCKTMSKDRRGNLAVSDEYTFTTLGKPPVATFTSSDLSISPSEVNIGERVTISVLVANTGDATGTYEATLNINGVVEAKKKVTVAAGKSESVSFTVSKDKAATE